jgi:hypothetical protein
MEVSSSAGALQWRDAPEKIAFDNPSFHIV